MKFNRRLICLFILCLQNFCLFSQKLVVHFTDIPQTNGEIIVCLSSETLFLHECIQQKSAEVSGQNTAEAIFENVPPGKYAISAFFDTNGNRTLDHQGLFKIPTEAFGFSQNPRLFFGPPRFKQCTFEVKEHDFKLYINLVQF